MWTDTHCHTFDKQFKRDHEQVLERARQAGVSKLITVGYNKWANRAALEEAKDRDDMWLVLGVHPCDCQDWGEEEEAWIKEQTGRASKVIAIGEIGLDYHHMRHPKEEQERVFREQICFARELDLPIVVHSRDAAEDTMRILEDEGAERVVLHCFPYDYKYAMRACSLGYFIGLGGVLTYPNAGHLREVAEKLPLDCLLLETDCPYLAPQKHRGKRNEPAYVVEVARKLADLRHLQMEELSEQLEKNLQDLFRFVV